jgi:glycine betaine/choline ABC-type transport system substrate-binding protein
MNTADLTKLNAEYVFDKKDIGTIAREWLTANGFL